MFGASNSPTDRPFKKVLYGKQQMCEITGRLNSVEQEEALITELMTLLNDTTRLVMQLDPTLEYFRYQQV